MSHSRKRGRNCGNDNIYVVICETDTLVYQYGDCVRNIFEGIISLLQAGTLGFVASLFIAILYK